MPDEPVVICIFSSVCQGAAVKMAEERGAPLDTLTVADLQSLHPSFESDVSAVWSYENRYFFPYLVGDVIGLLLRCG
jgi:hypothetical protein